MTLYWPPPPSGWPMRWGIFSAAVQRSGFISKPPSQLPGDLGEAFLILDDHVELGVSAGLYSSVL
jgi:hypothetical protein